MKKKLIAGMAVIALGGAGLTHFALPHFYQRHPTIEVTPDGWNFTYDLCIPMPAPIKCVQHQAFVHVKKGVDIKTTRVIGDPDPIDVETLEQATAIAENKADRFEGKIK